MNNEDAPPSPILLFCERKTITENDIRSFSDEAEKIIAKNGARVDLIINAKRDRIFGFYADGCPRLPLELEDRLTTLFENFFSIKARLTLCFRESTGHLHYRFTGI